MEYPTRSWSSVLKHYDFLSVLRVVVCGYLIGVMYEGDDLGGRGGQGWGDVPPSCLHHSEYAWRDPLSLNSLKTIRNSKRWNRSKRKQENSPSKAPPHLRPILVQRRYSRNRTRCLPHLPHPQLQHQPPLGVSSSGRPQRFRSDYWRWRGRPFAGVLERSRWGGGGLWLFSE